MQLTEYVEDLEMAMQLFRLGLFNPKMLNYDKLENMNGQNILNIKTSTWINYNDNHIPHTHLLFTYKHNHIVKRKVYNAKKVYNAEN